MNRNNDFLRVYRRGKHIVHSQIVLYYNKNRYGYTRIGITATKKVGNAVVRNRARRVIKNALFDVLPQDVGPYDIVVVARGLTPKLKSWQLAKTLQLLFEKSGILKKNK